jgi:hypothetical protein
MGWIGLMPAALALAAAAALAPATSAARTATAAHGAPQEVGDAAADLVQWIARTRDHGARPFAIVDKRNARIHVFDAQARLRGSSAVLIGQAPGDFSAPQVGAHAQAGHVPFHERTTPAGRFVTEPGRNDKGEDVVWVDYDSAFAIHRLRPGAGLLRREQRLASATPSDNRATLGCVVVPVKFYAEVVHRLIGERRAVVYVMPENGSLADMLAGM